MAPTAGEQHAAAAAATAAAAAAAAGSCSSEADCATPSSAATAAASLLAALGELADIQQPSLQEGDSDYELDEYEQLDLGDLFVNTDLREEVQDALARFLRPERVLLRDKLTFVLGIMHMVLSAYWLGCSPQTFYRLYTTEACVLITLRLAHYRWHRQHYYLLDWCYLANALVILSILKPTNILLAKVTFAHAMGPLLWSILAFRNSIVPHSLGKMTSHFMHWFPACVCWATRWKTSGALKAHLESFPAAQAQWESASLRDLVWLPLVPYLGWATLYYIKVFVISSKKIQERGYETLFQYSTKSRKSLFGAVVLRAPPRLQPVAYMGLHLLLTLTACLLNTLWWRSYIANTLFMVGVLTASAWSGATFYFDVFLFKYGLSNESRGANPSTVGLPPKRRADSTVPSGVLHASQSSDAKKTS